MDELILAVETAYRESPRAIINKVVLTLQGVLQESLKVKDGNTYKLPHIGKDKLTSEGMLPISIKCDPSAIAIAREALDNRDVEPPIAPNTTDLNTGGGNTDAPVGI
mmetsp:Transcript_23515/g.49451  ORF Transcript_23515/g.49451 Transcript_23515/m.49451 type:complete len:107 (-) Transcript_23515:98-418(-)